LPSRVLADAFVAGVDVVEHVLVEGVADLPLQRAQRGSAAHPCGDLPLVACASLAAAVSDLGDRGQVDGVVELPVPASGEPVDPPVAGGDFDRSVPL